MKKQVKKIFEKQELEKYYIPKIEDYPSENEMYHFIGEDTFDDYLSGHYRATFKFLDNKKFLILINGEKKIFHLKIEKAGKYTKLESTRFIDSGEKPDFVITKIKKN